MKYFGTTFHTISITSAVLTLICGLVSANQSSKIPNIAFLEDLVKRVENPAELVANVQKAFSNPDYLDKIFKVFDPSDFPDRPRPWDPEVEKTRFQSIMLGKIGNLGDQYKYLEIILSKVNTQNLPELEKIYTMSESLEFVIDFYQNAVRAEEHSSKFLASLENTMEELKTLIQYGTKSIKFLTPHNEETRKILKEQENGEISLRTLLEWQVARLYSSEDKEHDANLRLETKLFKSQADLLSVIDLHTSKLSEYDNLAEMAKVLARHAFNINFQIGLSHFKINTDKEPNIVFNLDVVKRLKDAYEEVEGLRNMVLVEKDAIKKARLEERLKEEEHALDIFAKTEDTMDQVRYISDASNLVVTSYARNRRVAAETQTKITELMTQYSELSKSRENLLKDQLKYREMVQELIERIDTTKNSGEFEYGMKIEL